MKLVVTGETNDGLSVVLREDDPQELVASAFPRLINTPLDASDGSIALPNDGRREREAPFFPPPGGYRFFLFRIEPLRGEDPQATSEQWEEAEAIFPGLFSGFDEQGFERTNTVDLGYVVSGQVNLMLSDGSQTLLEAGDAFVQNGTRHAWVNPGDTPAVLAVVVTGQERRI